MDYKSREDESGYIEGFQRLNESDDDYQSRLASQREKYAKEIREALNMDEYGMPKGFMMNYGCVVVFGVISLIFIGLYLVLMTLVK